MPLSREEHAREEVASAASSVRKKGIGGLLWASAVLVGMALYVGVLGRVIVEAFDWAWDLAGKVFGG